MPRSSGISICNSEYGCCEAEVKRDEAQCSIDLVTHSVRLPKGHISTYTFQYAQSFYYVALMLDKGKQGGGLKVKQSILPGSGWNADFNLNFTIASATTFKFPESSTATGYMTCTFGQGCRVPAGYILTVASPTATEASWYYYSNPDEYITVTLQLGMGDNRGRGFFSIYGLGKNLDHSFNFTKS